MILSVYWMLLIPQTLPHNRIIAVGTFCDYQPSRIYRQFYSSQVYMFSPFSLLHCGIKEIKFFDSGIFIRASHQIVFSSSGFVIDTHGKICHCGSLVSFSHG